MLNTGTENPKDHEYWQGTSNKLIRYYFYVNTGLNVFNNFKYLVAAIFGVYFLLHLKGSIWLIGMFVLSIPVLGVIGYYSIHHINKVMDWLNTRFGTYYGLLQINLLKEIRDGINKLNKEDNHFYN